jgi:polysaccharide biosynthesis protein PslG
VQRAVLTISTALLLLCVAAPAQAASKKPIVGIGEQRPEMFIDKNWQALGKPNVRYVMAWDALTRKSERASADWYLTWARDAGANVLLSFGHSNKRHRELRMPTRSQLRKQFKAVRARYPWVTEFQAWNEANHGTQPTFNRPKRAAMAFDVLKGACPTCTVAAPSVLDDGQKTINYIKAFDKAAKKKVTIWSLHNHIDANRGRLGKKSTTYLFLKRTRGQVWFTETGGIYNRWIPKKTGKLKHIKQYNRKNAIRAIKNIFKLQRLNPRRVTRIYYYNWYGSPLKKPRWDSGLMSAKGTPRATFRTFRAQVRKYAR